MPSSMGSSQPRDQIHTSLYLLHWQLSSLPIAPSGKSLLIYKCPPKDSSSHIPQWFQERFHICHQSLDVCHHINQQLQWDTLYVAKQTMNILKERVSILRSTGSIFPENQNRTRKKFLIRTLNTEFSHADRNQSSQCIFPSFRFILFNDQKEVTKILQKPK